MNWILRESGVYPIYGVIFLSGIARGFLNPATAAFQTQLVDKETFPNAATWSGIAWQTSLVLGPLMGGMLIVFGLYLAYSADLLLMSFGLILMLLVKGKPVPEKPDSVESVWESLSSGWKFVSTHQIILGAISLDLFAVLFGGAVALLPSFTEKILGQSPEIFGILRSAQGVGAVLCAFFIAAKPPKKHSGWILLSCVLGFGICIIFFRTFQRLSNFVFLSCGRRRVRHGQRSDSPHNRSNAHSGSYERESFRSKLYLYRFLKRNRRIRIGCYRGMARNQKIDRRRWNFDPLNGGICRNNRPPTSKDATEGYSLKIEH